MKEQTSNNEQIVINRNYKDRLFRMIFNEKKSLLELYNAMNGTRYEDTTQLEIYTLEDAIYMSMKNDVSFLIANSIHLYEHQSTWNPNMPLRGLFYIVDLYKGLTATKSLYSTKLLTLPTPVYIVFYNGIKEYPERTTLKLSDSFEYKRENACLEFTSTVININMGYNHKLMEQCKALAGYTYFVEKTRKYSKDFEMQQAVGLAIDECIKEGYLIEFLKRHKAEVMTAMLTEYDEEKVMAMLREEALEDGYEKGREEGREEGLSFARIKAIRKMKIKGFSKDDIADMLELDDEYVKEVITLLEKHPEKNIDELVGLAPIIEK